MVIKRIGAFSCAKMAGVICAIFGLYPLPGALTSLVLRRGGGVGIGMAISLPILYGCVGFLVALVASWLYNRLTGVVGGIKVEIE